MRALHAVEGNKCGHFTAAEVACLTLRLTLETPGGPWGSSFGWPWGAFTGVYGREDESAVGEPKRDVMGEVASLTAGE